MNHLLVKLCGLRTEADVAAANAARPDFAGFVIEVPGKRRSISVDAAIALAQQLDSGIRPVGVFVDAPVETVNRFLAEVPNAAVQLHGSEDATYIAQLRIRAAKRLSNESNRRAEGDISLDHAEEQPTMLHGSDKAACTAQLRARVIKHPPCESGQSTEDDALLGNAKKPPNALQLGIGCTVANPSHVYPLDARIIQAFRVHNGDDVRHAAASMSGLVLLDSGQGSGKPFDWRLLTGFPRPFLLAGGLGPDNLPQAIASAQSAAGNNFAGVDMSSSLEIDGVKNPAKMQAAVQAIRN